MFCLHFLSPFLPQRPRKHRHYIWTVGAIFSIGELSLIHYYYFIINGPAGQAFFHLKTDFFVSSFTAGTWSVVWEAPWPSARRSDGPPARVLRSRPGGTFVPEPSNSRQFPIPLRKPCTFADNDSISYQRLAKASCLTMTYLPIS